MARVRRATAADVDGLVAMGRAMHAESPTYRGEPFDEAKVRALAAHLLAGQGGVILVAEAAGDLVGMFAGVVNERWFGPAQFATDLVVYVRPEHRGGSAFARLVLGFEDWAAARGVATVRNGVSTGVHTDETVCAYQRMGYTLEPTRVVTKNLNRVHRT